MTHTEPERQGTAAVPDPRRRTGPAGIVSRGAAALTDAVTVLLLSAVLYATFVILALILRRRSLELPRFSGFLFSTEFVLLSIVYLFFWWRVGGRTVGSALMGVRLVSTGGRLGWAQTLVRATLCAVFPVGLLWVVVDPQRRRSLQDILLRTAVIYDEPAGTSEAGAVQA